MARELAKSKSTSYTSRIRVPLESGSPICVNVWEHCELMSLLNENVHTIGFIDAVTKKV